MMSFRVPPAAASILLLLAPSSYAPAAIGDAGSGNDESEFLAQTKTAMDGMMKSMSGPPAGNVDRDFVNLMVPHHQGAIDMAVAVLRYGHDEKIRRLAQEMIVDQQEEIAAMRRAVGESPAPSSAAPTTVPSSNL